MAACAYRFQPKKTHSTGRDRIAVERQRVVEATGHAAQAIAPPATDQIKRCLVSSYAPPGGLLIAMIGVGHRSATSLEARHLALTYASKLREEVWTKRSREPGERPEPSRAVTELFDRSGSYM